jgi:spermidine synthase
MTVYTRIRERMVRDLLLYVVFFTGAVILAVEVMAVRILSPYFGNTIYTFSSVISVILAALSLGYWRGGRMADANQGAGYFYHTIAKAGWSVIGMQFLSAALLTVFASMFSLTVGPLVASVVLFFYPSYLFGLLSPFVIKLRTDALPMRGVGTVSGEVFFASTLGSIFGSLLSGFVLVPMVGITTSMLSMGYLTVLLGMVGSARVASTSSARHGRYTQVLIGAVSALVLVYLLNQTITTLHAQTVAPNGTVQVLRDGVYARIAIVDGRLYRDEPSRVLLLDRTFSSGVTLPSGDLLFPYTQYYKLMSLFDQSVQHAAILGAGTGTVAKELLAEYPAVHIDMVDTEPSLLTLASEYFFMPVTPQIVGHVADGRQFLQTSTTSYDVIFGDMYAQLHAVPWHVSTEEYYRVVYDRLSEGGVYIANHIGSLEHTTPSLFWSAVATLSGVFGEVAVYGVTDPQSSEVQNMIVARKGGSLAPLSATTSDPVLQQLQQHRVAYQPTVLTEHKVYTDNLAPLELYASRMSAGH